MSRIVTFYSYKGGVGRTLALSNVAVLLAKQGKKVLVMDWDIEAPGLDRYFKDYLGPQGLEKDWSICWLTPPRTRRPIGARSRARYISTGVRRFSSSRAATMPATMASA
jgi:hypothetical protein